MIIIGMIAMCLVPLPFCGGCAFGVAVYPRKIKACSQRENPQTVESKGRGVADRGAMALKVFRGLQRFSEVFRDFSIKIADSKWSRKCREALRNVPPLFITPPPVRNERRAVEGTNLDPKVPSVQKCHGARIRSTFRYRVVFYYPFLFLPLFLRKTGLSEHSPYCFAAATVATSLPVPKSLSVVVLVPSSRKV